MAGIKLRNQYADVLGGAYEKTPKSVYAAIALALALRLCDDDFQVAINFINNEWSALYRAGIIPQRPERKA